MKNTIKFLTVLLVVGFTFTSCDEDDIKSLADITVDSSISGTYNLAFEAESRDDINESVQFSLSDNSAISAYINKLEEIKITKITYKITEFTGDHYVEMNVGLYQYIAMEDRTIIEPRNYNLEDEESIEYEITDTAILNEVSMDLFDNKQIKLFLEGDYQSLPAATAELIVTIYFEATANPL